MKDLTEKSTNEIKIKLNNIYNGMIVESHPQVT